MRTDRDTAISIVFVGSCSRALHGNSKEVSNTLCLVVECNTYTAFEGSWGVGWSELGQARLLLSPCKSSLEIP